MLRRIIVFDSLAKKVHGRHGVITKRFFDDCVDIGYVFLAERHVPGISHVRIVPLDVFKGRFLYMLVFWSEKDPMHNINVPGTVSKPPDTSDKHTEPISSWLRFVSASLRTVEYTQSLWMPRVKLALAAASRSSRYWSRLLQRSRLRLAFSLLGE